jgi:cytoskeletal protein CcmA (bactofilin family)
VRSPKSTLVGSAAVVGLLLAGYGLGTMSGTGSLSGMTASTTTDGPQAVDENGVPIGASVPAGQDAGVGGNGDASPGSCSGALGAAEVQEVAVPEGAVCSLDGTKVHGDVTVGSGAVLVARNASVGGDVEAEGALRVDLTGRSTVVGNLQLQRGGSSLVETSQIDGDLKWEEQGGLLVVRSSTISGNVQADGNSGGVFILDNRIEGDLECEENGPSAAGGNNTVLGGAEDCPLTDATAAPEAAQAPEAPAAPEVSSAPTGPALPAGSPPPSASVEPDVPTPPVRGGDPLAFTISSFNVLGSSHTGGSGKRPGMSSGPVRANGAAELVARHGADVVGFQELQADQLAVLRRQTDMDFFPGDRLKRRDSENSIGWRRDRWKPVQLRTVDIPYFDGHDRAMPYVRLRSLQTGRELWFANFHNPADTHRYHHQQRYRVQATSLEATLVNRLVQETGLPVLVTGDMNERGDYYCRITANAPLVAARGGTNAHGCQPGRSRAIDWILGTRDVTFGDYVEDRSDLVRTTTDHPVVAARVHVG